MSTMRSQDEIRNTVVSLGLPEHPYFMRRTVRAMDLLDTGKVNFVGDDIFRVHSQFDDTIYHVELNHGTPGCTCADHQKNPGVLCKHMIAATICSKQAPVARNEAITIVKTTEGNEGDYWRRCWLIAQGNRRTLVYEKPDGRLFCTCGAYYQDCVHKQLVIKTVTKELKAIAKEKPVVNECGSNEAKALQDKMNGQQLDSQESEGNGAQAPSQPMKLDLRNPFQQSEQNDIDQIEGRKNGELAWNIQGKYVISYKGIMRLAEKHDITFTDGDNSNTKQVIARARLNGSERISGKLPIPSRATAVELAKRNAARQLLPLEEIKAIEHKTKLNAEFSWQKAYTKCVELVGTEANVDIIIYELTKEGKLRQETHSHYDRTEWLIIHNACKQDAQEQNNDGGANTPSSNEVNRGKFDTATPATYKVLADAPVNENWLQRYDECKKLVGMSETDLIIRQELNFRYSYYKNKITDEQWDIVRQECQWRWNAKQAKAEFASAQQAYKFKHIRDISGYDVKSKQFVGRPPLNEKEFIAKCQEAIEQVRAENKVEANEQPLEDGNGKRKLQMNRKKEVFLIEPNGVKKPISCREICETFESKQNPSIVTRLRNGIDDGADISTVELN